MTSKTIMLLSAAGLALAACQSKTDTNTATATTTTSTNDTMTNDVTPAPAPSGAQGFVNTAAASDAFEIALSKLALDTSKTAAIKAFANQMIKAHTGSTEKLKGIVAKMTPPLTPDASLSADQQGTLDTLKTKTGADFDSAFAAAQVTAHQTALDGLKAYAATGDVPALKTFATGLEPTVTAHLNMAKGLK